MDFDTWLSFLLYGASRTDTAGEIDLTTLKKKTEMAPCATLVQSAVEIKERTPHVIVAEEELQNFSTPPAEKSRGGRQGRLRLRRPRYENTKAFAQEPP